MMKSIGILTDDSVQFPRREFPGAELVRKIPLSISISKKTISNVSSTEISGLPNSTYSSNQPSISPPTTKYLVNLLIEIKQEFDEIIIILPSKFLSPLYAYTKRIMETLSEKNKFFLFDSGAFSFGLGMLIIEVANELSKGSRYSKISQNIRFLIPQIFGVFCCPNLSYMNKVNFLDAPQAVALDFIGSVPIFNLEDGKFSSLVKIKKMKNYFLYFEEFIDEFEQPKEIIAINGNPSRFKELKALQVHCEEQFPKTRFSHQLMNIATASIIGPKAIGVFVLDKTT